MALYEIFSHSDRFHYRAHLCSLATCFLILTTILTLFSPFLFTYYSEGFWIKEATYSEQPRVGYSSEYILIVDHSDATTIRFFSSSYGSLNAAFQTVLIPGTNTFSASDTNSDGIIDQFYITIELLFGTTSSASLQNLNLWLLFQYELRARQYINMKTMALINLFPPGNIDLSNNPNVTIEGDLVLVQRKPIQSSGSDTGYNNSIINLNNLLATSSMNLNPVLDEYFTRNYYTTFEPHYNRWKSGAISGTNILTVNIVVNTKWQVIRFIPGFWQEFKWGWIQYVCVLLPFIIVFNRIKEFTFRSQLVRTLVEYPYHRHKD